MINSDFKLVYKNSDFNKIQLIKNMLESEGIAVFEINKQVSMYNLGFIELYVPANQEAIARTILLIDEENKN